MYFKLIEFFDIRDLTARIRDVSGTTISMFKVIFLNFDCGLQNNKKSKKIQNT